MEPAASSGQRNASVGPAGGVALPGWNPNTGRLLEGPSAPTSSIAQDVEILQAADIHDMLHLGASVSFLSEARGKQRLDASSAGADPQPLLERGMCPSGVENLLLFEFLPTEPLMLTVRSATSVPKCQNLRLAAPTTMCASLARSVAA